MNFEKGMYNVLSTTIVSKIKLSRSPLTKENQKGGTMSSNAKVRFNVKIYNAYFLEKKIVDLEWRSIS